MSEQIISCSRLHFSARCVSRLIPLLVTLLCFQFAGNPNPQARDHSPAPVQTPSPQQSATQSAQDVTTLEPGKPVEREISGGQRHGYQIRLSEGQHLTVVITQKGVSVGVTLRVPGGEVIPLVDGVFASQPEWTFGRVAESSGIHQYDIFTRAKSPTGRYEIRITELRLATESDRELQRARNIMNKALRLQRQGQYLEARPLMIEALKIREKVWGPDDPLLAPTLGVLAVNYKLMGDYVSAEPFLLRELKIKEKAQGPDHATVADVLTQLGIIHLDKGDYIKAEEIFLKSLGIYERAQQAEKNEVAWLSIALGNIHYDRGDYENAEKYFQRSRAILEKIFGPDHFHLTDSYSYLGHVAYDVGDFAKAEAMFGRALTLLEKGLGQDHPVVTGYRNHLAMVYCTTGEYAKAESLYRQSLLIHDQKAMMGKPVVQETLYGLARLYAAREQLTEAVKFQTQAGELEENYIELNLAAGSEREKQAFLANLSARASRNISMHAELAPNDPAARDLAVTTILRRKGRVQDAMSASLAALRQRFGAEDQKLLDQLSEVTSRLANLVLNGPQKTTPAEHQEQIKTVKEQREKLEVEISRRSAGFYRRAQPVTVAAVQQAIPDAAALIEFAIYRPFDPKKPDNKTAYGEPRYVAYVVHRQGEVLWKELGEAKAIDDAVSALRQALHDPKSKDVRQLARSLDERVMQPVRALLSEATQLLVSPDGQLNLIPFETLVDEQGRHLIQRYSFAYLSSGRDLLRLQAAREAGGKPPVVANPLLVADPSFGEPTAEQVAKLSGVAKPAGRGGGRRSVTNARDLSEVYFAPLGGTADEARTIRKLFRESDLLTGTRATESALKRVAAPRILHVATHGFFLQDTKAAAGSTPVASRGAGANAKIENPLLRSGLALAGANLRSGAGDDGILTALEASGLNLWGTKLVVLSACDTGVGEVRNGEGVYGLRRAFVLAGAESLVMSLWPVSDYPTKKLMTEYYQNLKQGIGRGEALRKAQLRLLDDKLHPFYWANFIQTGEWTAIAGK